MLDLEQGGAAEQDDGIDQACCSGMHLAHDCAITQSALAELEQEVTTMPMPSAEDAAESCTHPESDFTCIAYWLMTAARARGSAGQVGE